MKELENCYVVRSGAACYLRAKNIQTSAIISCEKKNAEDSKSEIVVTTASGTTYCIKSSGPEKEDTLEVMVNGKRKWVSDFEPATENTIEHALLQSQQVVYHRQVAAATGIGQNEKRLLQCQRCGKLRGGTGLLTVTKEQATIQCAADALRRTGMDEALRQNDWGPYEVLMAMSRILVTNGAMRECAGCLRVRWLTSLREEVQEAQELESVN